MSESEQRPKTADVRAAAHPLKWRKKPIVIEAWRWDGDRSVLCDIRDAPDWLVEAEVIYGRLNAGQVQVSCEIDGSNCQLKIATFEGAMVASPGDWIIRGVKGELYPCKPDIFAATYEPATEEVAPDTSEDEAEGDKP